MKRLSIDSDIKFEPINFGKVLVDEEISNKMSSSSSEGTFDKLMQEQQYRDKSVAKRDLSMKSIKSINLSEVSKGSLMRPTPRGDKSFMQFMNKSMISEFTEAENFQKLYEESNNLIS